MFAFPVALLVFRLAAFSALFVALWASAPSNAEANVFVLGWGFFVVFVFLYARSGIEDRLRDGWWERWFVGEGLHPRRGLVGALVDVWHVLFFLFWSMARAAMLGTDGASVALVEVVGDGLAAGFYGIF
jgi:hypothetical protein